MKTYLISFLISLHSIKCILVPRCPLLECEDKDFATDEDDWCVRINIDEQKPAYTTVKIRECLGNTKHFCDYSKPDLKEMVWPFNQKVLTERDKLFFFHSNNRFEAKCIDSNEYFNRGNLYAGWKCIRDMDCHSKKCYQGVCQGRIADETCI